MSFRKLILSGVLCACIFAGSINFAFAQNVTYKVVSGDTFWIVSNKFGISMDSLMKANNATQATTLYEGQTIIIPMGNQTVHTVQSGETYWTISKKYGVDFSKLLSYNNATEKSYLNIGDHVIIPAASQAPSQPPSSTPNYITHTITSVDSFWTLSKKYSINMQELMAFNGANERTQLIDGETVKIPVKSGSGDSTPSTPAPTPVPKPVPTPVPVQAPTKPYITYSYYTVQYGDNFWGLSEKFGITAQEIMNANNMSESSYLRPGTTIKYPVHHIPVKETPGAKYGELLDWWSEAQYVIPRGANFEVVDFYTGKSFMARRTAGSFHADCETLTKEDTAKMKEIWGGNFSWTRRPVIIKVDGRKVAASATAMPHAGNDYSKGGVWTTWRSGGYGAGINHDYIKGNDADGHFDIHFLNSTRHKDGELDTRHQANIQISSGKN